MFLLFYKSIFLSSHFATAFIIGVVFVRMLRVLLPYAQHLLLCSRCIQNALDSFICISYSHHFLIFTGQKFIIKQKAVSIIHFKGIFLPAIVHVHSYCLYSFEATSKYSLPSSLRRSSSPNLELWLNKSITGNNPFFH